MMSYLLYNVLNPIKIHSKDKDKNNETEVNKELSRYSMAELSVTEDRNNQN